MDHRLVDINAIIGFVFVLSKISIFCDTEPAGFKIIIVATSGSSPTHYRIFLSQFTSRWMLNWKPLHTVRSFRCGCWEGMSSFKFGQTDIHPCILDCGPQASAPFPLGVESLGFLWRFFYLPCSGHSLPWSSSSFHTCAHLEKAHRVLCGSLWHQSSGECAHVISGLSLPALPHNHIRSTVLYTMATAGFLVSWPLPPPGNKTRVLFFISVQGDPQSYPPLCL